MKRSLRSLALVVVLALVPRTVHAEDPPTKPEDLPKRTATFTMDAPDKGPTFVKSTFVYKDVIDKNIEGKLASGIPNTIAMRAYVFREGESTPVALANARTCTVTFDLWSEVYKLKVSSGGQTRDQAVLNIEGVVRNCAQVTDLTVVDKSLLSPGKPYFLGVIVEVNPISQQMLEQMRTWVSRPAGSTGISPSDALFGSFVGLFVRTIGNADRTLRFRTQSFTP